MLLLFLMAIFLPALVFLFLNEAKWSIKEKKATAAFYLAEAGIDQGAWKLNENMNVYNNVLSGIPIAGYNFDTVYNAATGQYKIWLTNGPASGEVTIRAIGRDYDKKETRSIEAIYSRMMPGAAIYSPNIEVSGNMDVHWGGVMSTQDIKLSGNAANKYYPRKFARGKIDPRDSNPVPPNTDGLEYWAYADIPNLPEIDLDYYRINATHHYSGNAVFNNIIDGTPKIYYVEGNAKLRNSYLSGSLIVKGDIEHTGGGRGDGIAAIIPSKASEEYQHSNAQSIWNSAGWSNGGTTTLNNILFDGFIYVGGKTRWIGNGIIHGVIVTNALLDASGTVSVYYDENVKFHIKIKRTPLTMKKWREIKLVW